MSSFLRAYPPARPPSGSAILLPFRNQELVVESNSESKRLLRADPALLFAGKSSEPIYLGALDGVPCLTCEIDDDAPLPGGADLLTLRAAFSVLPTEEAMLAGYAAQMLHWRRTSRFCPICAEETEPKEGDWGRRCARCDYDRYPHVSPAVLVLVHDGPRILLAHKPGWGDMHSILAGFVEPGESLEECVHREVMEEVGVGVTDLVYHGSQSWPFPHQLMAGFTARYAGGEIEIDAAELDGAAWFDRAAMPSLPSPISLSRQLINLWIAGGTSV